MDRGALGPMGDYRGRGVTEIPASVADDEPLHRRIHPTFKKEDGTVSSAAFTDREMSVDRSPYCNVEQTLFGYGGYGVAALLAATARTFDQEVISDPLLLNPAHALVKGEKPKSIARKLARASIWRVQIGESPP